MATAKKSKKEIAKKSAPKKVAKPEKKSAPSKKAKPATKVKAKAKPKLVAKKASTTKVAKSKKPTTKKGAAVAVKKGATKHTKQKPAPVSKTNKTLVSTAKSTKSVAKAWMQPLDDRILVEVLEENQTTPGGIIIVDSSTQPDNLSGFVLAVGRGHQNKKGRIRPIELKAGDKIIFSKYAGDKISKDGVNFVIIRETEVLGFASN